MKSKSKSLNALKVLPAISWWGGIVAAVFVIVVGIIAIANPSGTLGSNVVVDGLSINGSITGFASGVDASSLLAVTRDGVAANVEFYDPVKLKIGLPAAHWESRRPLLVFGLLAMLFVIGLSLLGLKLLRQIVWSVEAGNPFISENAERLRKMGVLIILGAFAKAIGNLISSGYADTILIPDGFNLGGHIGFDFGLLMIGLTVVVLSEVFRIGTKMREEQELTV